MNKGKIDKIIEAIGVLKTCKFKADDKGEHIVFTTANGGISIPKDTTNFERHQQKLEEIVNLLNNGISDVLQDIKEELMLSLKKEIDADSPPQSQE